MATQTKSVTSQPQQVATEQRAVATLESAVGAAFISGGIGSTVLGLAIIAAETNASIKTFLTWYTPSGPLSGKTGVAVIAFVLSWIILHYALRSRNVKLTTSFAIGIVLVVLGIVLSFPPVFLLFES